MGEYADYSINDMMDAYPDWSPYGSRRGHQPTEVTCKFCGKSGLRWEETDTGWVLIEGKYKIHNCRSAAASADDFEVLP